MALPTYVASGTAAASQNAVQVNWPAGHQADDIGILVIETSNLAAVTLSDAQGFVEVTGSPQGSGDGTGAANETRLTVFWCRATSSSMTGPTIADAGNHQIGQIAVFRGCIATGNPWDITAGDNAASSTAVAIPGGTTTVADCLILAMCASGVDNATPQFSGWANADLANVTERGNYQDIIGHGGGFGYATGEKATAGTFGATTATLLSASQQGRLMVALKPPVAIPPGTFTVDTATACVVGQAATFTGTGTFTVSTASAAVVGGQVAFSAPIGGSGLLLHRNHYGD